MNSAPKRAGIVGAGFISESHLAGLQRLAGVSTVAICDRSPGPAQALASEYGVADVYTDLGEMLAKANLDVIHVLTPPESHLAIAKQVIEHGVDVLLEKPMCHNSKDCRELAKASEGSDCLLGVSHNFLFFRPYESLRADLEADRFGTIDQIDIVWNKEFGRAVAGPHTGWLFDSPENVLIDIGSHSLLHVLDLAGIAQIDAALASHELDLSDNRKFYRQWNVLASRSNTVIRLGWSFGAGFPEHYIHIRGRSGAAIVDFERNTYVRSEHTAYGVDLDRFSISLSAGMQHVRGGTATIGRYGLGKLGILKGGKPFMDSIAASIETFYRGREKGQLDNRLKPSIAIDALEITEKVGRTAGVVSRPSPAPKTDERRTPSANLNADILVLGGTGFIGEALIRHLTSSGRKVRALSRSISSPATELLHPNVELVQGDFTNTETVEAALGGIETVYHLARGHGTTWDEYLKYDVEPTMRLAQACENRGVRRLFYTSSIAIYWAGKGAGVITEETESHPGLIRNNLYARSKTEIEKRLFEFSSVHDLGITVFRPGIVIGSGGSPLHWGIGAWPHNTVCRVWGRGNHALPFVLVDDCASAMVQALEQEKIDGKSYNLVGDVALTANEYLDALERVSGINIKRVPAGATRLFLEDLAKWAIKFVGRQAGTRFPSWRACDAVTLAAPFDCTAAKKDLSWRPTKSKEELIAAGIDTPAAEFLS